ncbi:CehA/McbA family metallohydrolase [Metabacillus hrfriensis]|uniref:CehA/McbA family metallohydrolase n=1 Tax=Metabacillus hrfriensis TaxID=3048891 RepID=A0ACD4RAX5_9BACI|nr:CehA/McbA family metallohydrolase [Metabacillus sp. CT-WN-B3]WHZ57582.1 CehA/McbA family metallohydrolase [Metabacillus sp. CT-WN-B3]
MSRVHKVTLSKRIEHSQQGEYITLPFSVPDDIEEIKVELSFSHADENIIDLGLEDPNGFKGWSGGARKDIFVREDRATPGYTLGELPAGEWGVILNAYRVPGACEVNVLVTLMMSEKRWLKGDLHLHSNHSDGAFTLAEVVENARHADLDFVALTDHNTFSQNYQYPLVEDLAVIPGVELTTNRGHCNFYGVHKPFADFRCATKEDVQEKLDEGMANGAVISINHPHCSFCSWEWGLEHFDVKIVEIWNGPWSKQNQAALTWWDLQLQQRKKIVAIGGSDTHRLHETIKYGTPTTWLYSDMHAPRKLLEALTAGEVCIAGRPTSPWIQMQTGETLMGGTFKRNHERTLIKIDIPESTGGLLKIITDQGDVFKSHKPAGTLSRTIEIPDSSLYVRAELWDAETDTPIVISNPIYFS